MNTIIKQLDKKVLSLNTSLKSNLLNDNNKYELKTKNIPIEGLKCKPIEASTLQKKYRYTYYNNKMYIHNKTINNLQKSILYIKDNFILKPP